MIGEDPVAGLDLDLELDRREIGGGGAQLVAPGTPSLELDRGYSISSEVNDLEEAEREPKLKVSLAGAAVSCRQLASMQTDTETAVSARIDRTSFS